MDRKFGKLTSLALATIIVASALLVFTPTASAQQSVCTAPVPVQAVLKVETQNQGGSEIRPITGEGTLKATASYTYPQGGRSLEPINFIWSASVDQGWATVVLSKSTDSVIAPQADQGPQTIESEVTGTVFLTKDAPFSQKVTVTFIAEASGGTCIVAPNGKVSGPIPITAGWYGKMQARLDKTIIKAGQNANIQLPLIVQNFGNGELLTKYELLNPDDTNLNVVLPDNIIIPPAVGSTLEPQAQFNVDVNTPFKNGYENRLDTLSVKISSVSNDNPEITGPEAQVTALIRTQGVYVPGFELVTMLAAAFVALAGVVRRRD